MSQLLRPTAVITAHMNADYDALAAMVAAGKLYPEATLVAPTMLERQDSHIFSDSITGRFNMKQPRECYFSQVRLLVLVDTHQQDRIEHVHEILNNPGLEIHVYDHHRDSDTDVKADFSDIRLWGSTSAILTHLIKEKGLRLSPDEATMLGLGIYEDTGSFTYSSTTEHDLYAAAFLRSCEMNLETIAEIISTDLTGDQVYILNSLLQNSTTHVMRGIPILVTEITLDHFMGDFASLVTKLMEMENIKVIFALAAMGDRVHLIARSRMSEIDVGHICYSFGGGGHSGAASASIKHQPLAELKAQLLAFLATITSPKMVVGKHMTAPAICIREDLSMEMADELMTRYGFKAMPVYFIKPDKSVGLLDQQTAARAVAHKLGKLPVKEYMQRNVSTLSPDADLNEAMEIILKQRQRMVPVMDKDEVVGVLTRTDVIRLLIDDTLHIPEGSPLTLEHQETNVASRLDNQLPEEHVRILQEAGKLGDAMGMGVFAVGGFVRDLMLRLPNLDIDLSVEGDGIAFAERLAQRLGGSIRPHHKFKTARVFYKDDKGEDQHLDVATARLEYYERPAALPTVELASIKMDLYRRDFTINALAIQLNEKRFGMLIDPFGGQRGLRDGTIKVMHSLSFVEDPTRILRAVRFERRFQFRIGKQTESLIKNALSLQMFDKLSGSRLFNELRHIFDEKDVPSCIRRMEDWNLLRIIHPVLRLTPSKDIVITSIDEVLAWYRLLYKDAVPCAWMLYLLGLCDNAKYPEVVSLLERLAFIEKTKSQFLLMRENVRKAAGRLRAEHSENPVPISKIYEILHPLEIEGLLYLMARNGHEYNIGQDVSLYLSRLKNISLDITGADLTALGEIPGPLYGEALKHVLAAKLDGRAPNKEIQLELAARFMAASHTEEIAKVK